MPACDLRGHVVRSGIVQKGNRAGRAGASVNIDGRVICYAAEVRSAADVVFKDRLERRGEHGRLFELIIRRSEVARLTNCRPIIVAGCVFVVIIKTEVRAAVQHVVVVTVAPKRQYLPRVARLCRRIAGAVVVIPIAPEFGGEPGVRACRIVPWDVAGRIIAVMEAAKERRDFDTVGKHPFTELAFV